MTIMWPNKLFLSHVKRKPFAEFYSTFVKRLCSDFKLEKSNKKKLIRKVLTLPKQWCCNRLTNCFWRKELLKFFKLKNKK